MKKAVSDSLKRTLIGTALSVALMSMAGAVAPSMAEDSLEQDSGSSERAAAMYGASAGRAAQRGTHKSLHSGQDGPAFKKFIDKVLNKMAGESFKVCKNQTYALCAAARCNVYDGVALSVRVKHGDSISLPFPMGDKDVCSVNAAGADNKYMISTYSLPESIASPQGGGAVYTCSGEGSGAYAQCDGGICFRALKNDLPGFDTAVRKGQIICSCPITQAKSGDDAKVIKFSGLILATSPSFGTAKPPPYRKNGFDDQCRCSDWHGSGSGGPTQRQAPVNECRE